MESVQDMSGCGANQKAKYTAGSFIGKALTWWNTQVQTKGQEATVGMTWEDFKVLISIEFYLNNEIHKLETKFWCHARVGASHAVYTDRVHELARDDNKRSRTGRAFATITNPVRKEYTGHFPKDCRVGPRMVTYVNANNLKTARGACFKCGGTNHYKAACPRLNRAPRPGGNRQNQPMAIEGGQGRRNIGNQACGGAFMMGANEACQDPNIMTVTFTLNNHCATTLYDSRTDYSFVSTTFIPLLDIEPSDLGFSYDIKLANGKLEEISKVKDIKEKDKIKTKTGQNQEQTKWVEKS
nr:reverse transcriptase domain-containing protein [Tanacetum cinerariifolium]